MSIGDGGSEQRLAASDKFESSSSTLTAGGMFSLFPSGHRYTSIGPLLLFSHI